MKLGVVHGGSGGGYGTPGAPVNSSTRRIKVYELVGADLVYQIDNCGAFQSGKFAPGESVEYRVDGERLYIRHDGDKEYKCKIEGTRKADAVKPPEGAKPDAPPAAASPAKQ